jgi:hypothetical protein
MSSNLHSESYMYSQKFPAMKLFSETCNSQSPPLQPSIPTPVLCSAVEGRPSDRGCAQRRRGGSAVEGQLGGGLLLSYFEASSAFFVLIGSLGGSCVLLQNERLLGLFCKKILGSVGGVHCKMLRLCWILNGCTRL